MWAGFHSCCLVASLPTLLLATLGVECLALQGLQLGDLQGGDCVEHTDGQIGDLAGNAWLA